MNRSKRKKIRILYFIRELIRKTAVLPIVFYRRLISPLKPRCCRFVPSCSEYALEAVMTHGVIIGFFLALKRILRCNPFGGCGHDPVPEYGSLLPERMILRLKEKVKKTNNTNNTKDKDRL